MDLPWPASDAWVAARAVRDIGSAKQRGLDGHFHCGPCSAVDRIDAGRKPVTIGVLKVNPRAQALYEKLGFVVNGESETHNFMKLG